MIDFEARKVIEALRSGIPSRTIGQYFSSARPDILSGIEQKINGKDSGGMVVLGKYGEGKTHLLNTVFDLAQNKNMAVSIISLSKETPFSRLDLVYHKIASNTYLPGHMQPGFEHLFENMSPSSTAAVQLLDYAQEHLETQKLFLLLKAYLNTDNYEDRFTIISDFQGDFITNVKMKQLYKNVFPGKITVNTNFVKTKHAADYIRLLSRLFTVSGLNGWVILVDETELIGQLGKKSRLSAYLNMSRFLVHKMENIFALFVVGASFVEDVIHSKQEHDNLQVLFENEQKDVEKILYTIENAKQLAPLNQKELAVVLNQIKDFHSKAFNWNPDIEADELCSVADSRSALLRTRIRAAIEALDQLYQYGKHGAIMVGELEKESYEEELPLPEAE